MGQIISDVTDILNNQNAKKSEESSRKQILSEMAKDNRDKENLVKKVLATQRAKYGAGGMSNNGMTEEAVLERLKQETSGTFESKHAANLNKLKNMNTKKKNLVTSILKRLDKLVG